jgi:hypothetical protein
VAIPRFELAAGVVDGVNLIFTTPTPYLAGSVAVFLNGQLKRADFMDGWAETSPTLGTITLGMPPEPASNGNPDDVVQVFYLEAGTPPLPETEVTPLRATIRISQDIFGQLQESAPLLGAVLDAEAGLVARLLVEEGFGGSIEPLDVLRGTIGDC